MLCTPRLYIRYPLFFKSNEVTEASRLNRLLSPQYGSSCSILQAIRQRGSWSRGSLNSCLQSEYTFFILFLIQRRNYFIICNILLGSAVKIYITLNAAKPPHILALQIGTGTPTVYFQGNRILTFLQLIRDIPFCRSLRTLVIAK